MSQLSPIKLNVAKKLMDHAYRRRFFRNITQDEIASQIREWRARRNLRQVDLAKLSGMKQSAISRLEQAEYSGWTFNSLMRIANALDVRIHFKFQSTEEAIAEVERLEAGYGVEKEENVERLMAPFPLPHCGQPGQRTGLDSAFGIRERERRSERAPVNSLEQQAHMLSMHAHRGHKQGLPS